MKTELKQITYKTLEKISNFIISEYKELEEQNPTDYTKSEIQLINLNPYAKGLQASISFTAKHFSLHKVNRILRNDYSNLDLWNVSIHARENNTFFIELDFSIR